MTVFETTSALGYLQVAYLVKVEGNKYLVIESSNNDTYYEGTLVELDDHEVEVSNRKLEQSPLNGFHLFDVFIEQLRRLQYANNILVKTSDLVGW